MILFNIQKSNSIPGIKQLADNIATNCTSLNEDIYSDTTGTLLMKFKRNGIRDVEKISVAMDELRSKQIAEGIFSFDFKESVVSN